MPTLLYFQIDPETSIAAEIKEEVGRPGFEEASPKDVAIRAAQTFGAALAQGFKAADAALAEARKMVSRPDEVELELGFKMSTEAGVVLASTAAEGHITLRLVWRSAAG